MISKLDFPIFIFFLLVLNSNPSPYYLERGSSVENTLSCSPPLKVLLFATVSLFFFLWVRLVQPNPSLDMLLYLYKKEIVRRIYYPGLKVIWTLLYAASPGSIALPRYAGDTSHLWCTHRIPVWKKLRDWQNCSVCYHWMIANVLIFSFRFHQCFFKFY